MKIEVDGEPLWGGDIDYKGQGIYLKKMDASNPLSDPLDDSPPMSPEWLRDKFHPIYYTIGWKYCRDGKIWGDYVCIPAEFLQDLKEQLNKMIK
jgi:hypothetical protein